ncbi:MAG: hypothetical protein AB1921_16035 [Thermodesulfobacteriota bacterium]
MKDERLAKFVGSLSPGERNRLRRMLDAHDPGEPGGEAPGQAKELFGCGQGFRETLSDFAADFGSGRADVAMLAWRATGPDGCARVHFNWFAEDGPAGEAFLSALADRMKARLMEFISPEGAYGRRSA